LGAALVAIGILVLVGILTKSEVVGLMVLPMLGLLFLSWGIVVRLAGPLTAGGILTGLGAGVLATQFFMPQVSESARGGVIVFGLALGFLTIVPLTRFFAAYHPVWPLIPGGILLVVGLSLMIGGAALRVVDVLGTYLWPAALIAGGGYLLWRAYSFRQDRDR
jgi:hypothetical protein